MPPWESGERLPSETEKSYVRLLLRQASARCVYGSIVRSFDIPRWRNLCPGICPPRRYREWPPPWMNRRVLRFSARSRHRCNPMTSLQPYMDDDGLAAPIEAHVVVADKS